MTSTELTLHDGCLLVPLHTVYTGPRVTYELRLHHKEKKILDVVTNKVN